MLEEARKRPGRGLEEAWKRLGRSLEETWKWRLAKGVGGAWKSLEQEPWEKHCREH